MKLSQMAQIHGITDSDLIQDTHSYAIFPKCNNNCWNVVYIPTSSTSSSWTFYQKHASCQITHVGVVAVNTCTAF